MMPSQPLTSNANFNGSSTSNGIGDNNPQQSALVQPQQLQPLKPPTISSEGRMADKSSVIPTGLPPKPHLPLPPNLHNLQRPSMPGPFLFRPNFPQPTTVQPPAQISASTNGISGISSGASSAAGPKPPTGLSSIRPTSIVNISPSGAVSNIQPSVPPSELLSNINKTVFSSSSPMYGSNSNSKTRPDVPTSAASFTPNNGPNQSQNDLRSYFPIAPTNSTISHNVTPILRPAITPIAPSPHNRSALSNQMSNVSTIGHQINNSQGTSVLQSRPLAAPVSNSLSPRSYNPPTIPLSQMSLNNNSVAPRPVAPLAMGPPTFGSSQYGGSHLTSGPLAPSRMAPPPLAPPTMAPPPVALPSMAPPPMAPPPFARPPLAPPPVSAPPLGPQVPLTARPATQQSTYTRPSYVPPPSRDFQQQNFQPQQQQQNNFSQQIQQQQQNIYPSYQQTAIKDGWNKGWGTDSIDLLQQRQILPNDGVFPPLPVLAQDFLRNCDPELLRCTFTKVPETKNLLQKAKMPFGILIHPFKDLEQLPVVSCQQIVRCRACRTYINPFVLFRGDRRWECNLCYKVNELPEEFQYDPVSETYGDPSRRPEVREATIEYIAPSEYMLRPPQPAVYLWLLDTSRQAVDTGYLKTVCNTLLEQLDNIPGDKRALIGFMTFSATVQFYLMPEGSTTVNMLEVGDLQDIFVPHPDDLLVNLHHQRDQIEELLTSLPETHANTTHTQSALGPALTAAFKLLSPLGGRVSVFTAMLPNIGPGALLPREDPNQRAATDVLHLNPATDFYKKLALDCSGQQIAVDLFTLNSQYIDLATLSGVSKFSGGCIHHFPNFHVHMNPPSVAPFVSCLTRYITRKIGFEAVMRIRATRGLTITNFHGHFFVRSPDLLSLPNINPDSGFAMQVCIEEPLHNIRTAAFQAALLYTSSRGERRIRVHTLCLPVTGNLHDIVNSVDQQAAVALLARMAVDRCHSSTSTDARDALVNASVDALTSYKNTLTHAPGRTLMACHNIKLWPLYTLALLKSVSFAVKCNK